MKDSIKKYYASIGHQRHHSDLVGMYSDMIVNHKDNSFERTSTKPSTKKSGRNRPIVSQKKIIREVFSPPAKKRRVNKSSYDDTPTYGSQRNTNGSFEGRNYTPNTEALNSFDNPRNNYPIHRNFTSDGANRNINNQLSNVQNVSSGQWRPGIRHNFTNNSIKMQPNMKFVYLTPYEYHRRKSDAASDSQFSAGNVFKIPSQRVLIENTDYTLD